MLFSRIGSLMIGSLVLSLTIMVAIFSSACKPTRIVENEILIALKPEAVARLKNPNKINPLDTGIPSLDVINRKWGVRRMERMFPNVAPDDEIAARYGLASIYLLVVPVGTDLEAMVRDYRSDPHIDYAEINTPYVVLTPYELQR